MSNDNTTPSAAMIAQLQQLSQGYIKTQLLFICVELKLAEILSTGARSVDQITALTQCHEPTLTRFLDAMCSIGLINKVADNLYGPGPILPFIDNLVIPGFNETSYQAWGKSMHAITTGKPAWDEVFELSFFDYLDHNPQQSLCFDQWNTATALWLDPMIERYDFSPFNTLVDLGGGQGKFLTSLLAANAGLHGILFDRQEVINNAKAAGQDNPEQSRLTMQAGSFFDTIPAQADAYTLCRVLLNWSDEQAIEILKACKNAMLPSSKLLILDFYIPAPDHPSYTAMVLNDLNLLMNCGGGSRSKEKWCDLVSSSGLKIRDFITEQQSPLFLLEATI